MLVFLNPVLDSSQKEGNFFLRQYNFCRHLKYIQAVQKKRKPNRIKIELMALTRQNENFKSILKKIKLE